MICSDGLTGMVKDEEIEAIATSDDDMDVVCEKLITTANKNGGLDNITVVAVRVERGRSALTDRDGCVGHHDGVGDVAADGRAGPDDGALDARAGSDARAACRARRRARPRRRPR